MTPHLPTQPAASRRQLLRVSAAGVLAAAAGATVASRAAAQNPIPPTAQAIMDHPRYAPSRWFLYVADRATGDPLYNLNGGDLVLPASTTKLWSTGAALDAYGPDFRFETPVYRRGQVTDQGDLTGDLV